jgi:hypothetical protein
MAAAVNLKGLAYGLQKSEGSHKQPPRLLDTRRDDPSKRSTESGKKEKRSRIWSQEAASRKKRLKKVRL